MAGLPDPGVEIDRTHTALVITDPQNDFLSPEGVTWELVGESVTENNTVEHIDLLLKAAKQNEIQCSSLPTTTIRLITDGSSREPSRRSCTTSGCSTGRTP